MPVVLNIEQIKSLLVHLKEPGKTAVLVDILTGLRVSALLALKWSDVDFQNLEVHVVRSIALQRVGPCKTEASQKPVPLDPELAEVLLMWRRRSPYPMDSDWVFASPAKKGALPYWSFSLFRVYQTSPQGGWYYGKSWLAHLPPLVRNDSEVAWGGREDSAGIASACQ